MFAKLSALVSGSGGIPYDLTVPDGERTVGGWIHYSATSKADKSAVSLFKFTFTPSDDKRKTEAARHGVKSLRTLRHPNVLVFKDSLEIEEKNATSIYLVTEPVRLLTTVLTDGRLSEDASVFLSDVYKCPEFAKQDWQSLVEGPPWAIDSWGLGCLIREVFGGAVLHSTESLRETSCIPEELLKDYQRLLNSHGAKRLNPHRLMKNRFLHNQLIEVVSFLESLAVKEATEKNTFFKKLSQNLAELPEMVVHQKILPMVIDALEFGGASPNALSCVMKIAEEMNEDQFQATIAPALTRFFNSSDRTIRRVLLENVEKFGDRLPSSLIDETIYPALSNGFSDSNAYLRELTLKSMQHFAAKLSQKTLNQSLLKFLARLQVDPEPSIRANTTVLLGFIADHLGEASCKRILLNAFSRALKDQFPATRLAALKALVMTKKYYSTEEVATKLIPVVSPLSIDIVEDVRKQGLNCLDTFVGVLREAAVANLESSEESIGQETKPSTGRAYVSWAVSSLGFSQGTETEKPIEKKPPPPPVLSSTSSPVKTESKPSDTFHDASSLPVDSSSSEEDQWDFDDEPFDAEPESPKPRPVKSTPAKKPTDGSSRVARQSGEPDLWDDLGMKADMPQETTPVQRRKPKGASKPMKLGAKKLS